MNEERPVLSAMEL